MRCPASANGAGPPGVYIAIHAWFDESKKIIADFRHRALRHHAEGIFMAETIFGATITLSTGRMIPVRWVSEQHLLSRVKPVALADKLQLFVDAPIAPRVQHKPCDIGLFDEVARRQLSLF